MEAEKAKLLNNQKIWEMNLRDMQFERDQLKKELKENKEIVHPPIVNVPVTIMGSILGNYLQVKWPREDGLEVGFNNKNRL